MIAEKNAILAKKQAEAAKTAAISSSFGFSASKPVSSQPVYSEPYKPTVATPVYKPVSSQPVYNEPYKPTVATPVYSEPEKPAAAGQYKEPYKPTASQPVASIPSNSGLFAASEPEAINQTLPVGDPIAITPTKPELSSCEKRINAWIQEATASSLPKAIRNENYKIALQMLKQFKETGVCPVMPQINTGSNQGGGTSEGSNGNGLGNESGSGNAEGDAKEDTGIAKQNEIIVLAKKYWWVIALVVIYLFGKTSEKKQ